jgi:hypothetical protein
MARDYRCLKATISPLAARCLPSCRRWRFALQRLLLINAFSSVTERAYLSVFAIFGA